MRKIAAIASGLLLLASLLACTPLAREPVSEDPESPEYPRQSMEMVAPAGPGSGYDLTIRSVVQCLIDTKLVPVPMPVTNKPGGGGIVSLEYLDESSGADNVLAVFSPPICLININGSTKLNYKESTTPVAMLITECGLFAVREDAPYETIMDVMDALREDPKALRIGGISAEGSMDHIQFLKMAHAAGVENLDQIEYRGFQDGTASAQLLGGHVDLISTGISDIIGLVESGDVRALATTADRRVGNSVMMEIPTCMEQGVYAAFYNWRGIFGPRDMPKYARDYWENVLYEMSQTPQWEETCKEFGWSMEFAGYADFEQFLAEADREYRTLLQDIGLP